MASGRLISCLHLFFQVLLSCHCCHAQPTFDECKIFLVASDTARDLSLNQQPEYIRFLNLVARTFLMKDDFTSFDNLPAVLQSNYEAFAENSAHEIDISAAAFGLPKTEESLKTLREFCDETARLVATLMVTEAPTFAPTKKLQTTGSPTISLSFDQETSSSANTLLTGPSDALSELPIICRRGLFGSDIDHDGYLTPMEYAMFINQVSAASAHPHSMEFDKLPEELQSNFYRLADDGLMNIFGALPNQWTQASKEQRSFLQLICYRTEDALQEVTEESTPIYDSTNYTESIDTILATPPPFNQSVLTLPPRPILDTTLLANETIPPTIPSASQGNEESGERKSRRHAIAAVIGTILIVLVGFYMARDKQSAFHLCMARWWTNRPTASGRRKKVSPFWDNSISSGIKKKKKEVNSREQRPTTCQSKLDDLDSTEENTGFLEDFRIGNSLQPLDEDLENQKNFSRSSNSVYDFRTARFNPDEFIASAVPPPQYANPGITVRFNPDDFMEADDEVEDDEEECIRYENARLSRDEENSINADFQDYRFDHSERSCDDSSAMSLYCTSVAEEKLSSVGTHASKKTIGGSKTSDTDVLSDLSSPTRRPLNTMYQASRFGKIAQSESKLELEGVPPKRKSAPVVYKQETASVKSPNHNSHRMRPTNGKKPPSNSAPTPAHSKPPKGKSRKTQKMPANAPTGQIEMKTPKAANKKIKRVKKRSSNRTASVSNPTDASSSESLSHKSQQITKKETNLSPLSPASEPNVNTLVGDSVIGLLDAESTASNFTDLYDSEFPDKSSTTPSLSFSYGGKSYNIDLGDGALRPQPSRKGKNSIGRMQSMDIAMEQQFQHDSISESTSFLSDDFSDDDLPAAKKEFTPPPFRRPNLVGRVGPRPDVRPIGKVKPVLPVDVSRVSLDSITASTGDKKQEKPMNHASLTKDMDDSNSIDKEEISLSDSDSDSTYDGTESNTSTSYTFPEASSTSTSIETPEGDPIDLIHHLVPIVLPSEIDKTNDMLKQYKGRERDLLKTLKRLEIRMKARQSVGNTSDIPESNIPRSHPTNVQAIGTTNKPEQVFSGGPIGYNPSEGSERLIDLEMSSSVDEDYSQDSTYVEEGGEDVSTSVSFSNHDDESLSIFSDLR